MPIFESDELTVCARFYVCFGNGCIEMFSFYYAYFQLSSVLVLILFNSVLSIRNAKEILPITSIAKPHAYEF